MNKDLSNPVGSLSANAQVAGDEMLFVNEYLSK